MKAYERYFFELKLSNHLDGIYVGYEIIRKLYLLFADVHEWLEWVIGVFLERNNGE